MPQDDDAPIRALSELEQEVSPQFLNAVRKKIQRRTAVNQVAGFSWNLPKVILLELMALIANVFSARKRNITTDDE